MLTARGLFESPLLVGLGEDNGGTLFVNDHIEVAWLVVDGRQPFESFKVLWSVHGEDGRVPPKGNSEISVAYRAEGLLNVRPVN